MRNNKFQKKDKVKRWLAGGLILLLIVVGATLFHKSQQPVPVTAPVTQVFSPPAQAMRQHPREWFKEERDISSAVRDIRAGKIVAAGLADDAVLIETREGNRYFVADTRYGRVGDLVLSNYRNDKADPFPVVFLDGVKRHLVPDSPSWKGVLDLVGQVLSLLFLLSVVVGGVFLIRQNFQKGFSLSKRTDVKFTDVIGAVEAKSALQDIVTYLRAPKQFSELGGRPPHGVLLVGPPGTGKTRLAQALAGECGVSFISANGSDFSSKYYGVAIQRVKMLFKLARENAPCIILIDEIDGIGKRTSSGEGAAAAESNRIINQMLVEMNGFDPKDGVIVIGATNLVEMLDEAMLRPGRFDRTIHVRYPELTDRAKIFELYGKQVKLAADIDFARLARLTTGMSPASLEAIVNQSALLAAKESAAEVTQEHLHEAIEIARMGEPEKGAQPLGEAERRRVAVHEAGHAFVAQLLGAGRVEKVTILPRGGALGVTLVTHDEERRLLAKRDLENRILLLLGGRCAEILLLQEASSGAAHDLQEASRIALAMVSQFGLGEEGRLFNLTALTNPGLAQGEWARAVSEADSLLRTLEARCAALLAEAKPALIAFSEALFEAETLPGEAVLEALERYRLLKAA